MRKGALAACLAVLTLLVGARGAAAQGDDQQSLLAGIISKILSSPDGQVRIGAVEGALSSDATIREVEVSDATGPWLRLDRARLIWRRTALLKRQLEVERLEIGRIEFLRKPVAAAAPPGKDNAPLLPELPLKVIVSTLTVGDLVLGAPVAGAPARLSVTGSLSLGAPSEGLQATIAARRQDRDGESDLKLSFVPDAGVLEVLLRHQESPGGLVAHALDIEGRPAVRLAVQGAGPLDRWRANLDFAAGEVARAAGTVTIGRQGAARRVALDLAGEIERLLPPFAATVFSGQTGITGAVDFADDGAIALPGLRLASDQAEVTMSGTLDASRQLSVETRARALPARGSSNRRVAALKSLMLEARATGPVDALLVDGRLSGEISRLDAFADDIGVPVSGTARLAATLSGRPAENIFDAAVQLDGASLAFGNPRFAALLGNQMALSGKVFRRGARVALETVALKARRIDATLDAAVELHPDRGAHGDLRLSGKLDGRALGGRTGFAAMPDGGLTLSEIDLRAAGAKLTGALVMAVGGVLTGTLLADVPDLASFSGALGMTLRGALSAEAQLSAPQGTQQAALKARGRNLAGFGASLAALEAEALIRGAFARPSGTFRAALTGLQHPEAARAGIPRVQIKADGKLAGDHAVIDANLNGGPALSIKVAGEAPLTAGGRLGLKITGAVDAALANARLAGPGQRLTGKLALDGHLRGTPARPLLEGAATISGGSFVDLLQGTRFTAIAGRIAGMGTAMRIENLTAATPGGGQVAINGTVQADVARGFPASLRLTGTNARLVGSDVVTLVAGLNLDITGPLAQAPVISGQVDVVSFDVTIPDRLPAGSAPLANARHLAPPEQTRERLRLAERANSRKQQRKAGPLGQTRVAVRINAPSRIFVRGRGIDAEFGGDVALTGTLSAPRAAGGFELRRGRINMLTQRLEFSRGRLMFLGDIVPDLDFIAATSAGGVTAKLAVTGRADSPAFALTSEPQLPPDEVLSRLMFERAVGTLSPLQAVQLAQAVARLTGRGGPDFLDKTRQALGVDTLDVTADRNGPSVGASRYITRDIRLGVKAGATPEQSGVTANVDVGRRIRLQGETGPSGRTSIGIGAEIEY